VGPFQSATATSCTDDTRNRSDGTRCAGIIPRTVTRPRPACLVILLLCVTLLRAPRLAHFVQLLIQVVGA
jgi:hypothetical protein